MSEQRVPVVMPRLGESIVEGTLVAWRKGAGEAVERGEVIAEIETDKATSEIFAPAAGTLGAPKVAEGETVEVGALLAEIEGASASSRASSRASSEAASSEATSSEGTSSEGTSSEAASSRAAPSEAASRRAAPSEGTSSEAASSEAASSEGTSSEAASSRAAPSEASRPSGAVAGRASEVAHRADGFGDGAPFGFAEPSSSSSSARLPTPKLAPRPLDARGGPARSSPAVRRLARERGVDLHRLEGSGAQGRVTKQDVLDAVGPAAPKAAAKPLPQGTVPRPGEAYRLPVYTPTEGDTVEPFSRRRAQVADHMITSLSTAAHVAAVTEIDMKRVLDAKRADAAHPSAKGCKLSVTAYVVHALAGALAEHPRLNASVRGRELVLRGERNIGVAVDTEGGLVVPVIHRADELGLVGVARRLNELAEAARAGRLRPDMVQGGSFTLSNPGPDGNLFGISVIRQPEVAILRAGAVVKRAVVRTIEGEDAIVIRPVMYAALSYDHRVIDGRVGNAFLRAFVGRLEGLRPQLASDSRPL